MSDTALLNGTLPCGPACLAASQIICSAAGSEVFISLATATVFKPNSVMAVLAFFVGFSRLWNMKRKLVAARSAGILALVMVLMAAATSAKEMPKFFASGRSGPIELDN